MERPPTPGSQPGMAGHAPTGQVVAGEGPVRRFSRLAGDSLDRMGAGQHGGDRQQPCGEVVQVATMATCRRIDPAAQANLPGRPRNPLSLSGLPAGLA